MNTDAWDGYAAERAELLTHLQRNGVQDVAFVTGDIHTFFAGNVTRTGRQMVGGETSSRRARRSRCAASGSPAAPRVEDLGGPIPLPAPAPPPPELFGGG